MISRWLGTSLVAILLLAMFFASAWFSVGRPSGNSAPPSRSLTKSDLEEVLGPNQEQVALLAAKSGLDEGVVKDILVTYLEQQDSMWMLAAQQNVGATKGASPPIANHVANKRPIAATIEDIATRHSIQRDRVAAIIVDYRAWEDCSNRR